MSADNNPQRRNWSWPFGRPLGELKVSHDQPDTRDRRDPETLGRTILHLTRHGLSVLEAADCLA